MFILTSGLGLTWFPAPFLQCDPLITPGGSGVLAEPGRTDEEFRKAWLPYFCSSGQRETSLEEFNSRGCWVAPSFAGGFLASSYWRGACWSGRTRLWPNRLWPSLSDRLWPNRLWPNRLWPKLRFQLYVKILVFGS